MTRQVSIDVNAIRSRAHVRPRASTRAARKTVCQLADEQRRTSSRKRAAPAPTCRRPASSKSRRSCTQVIDRRASAAIGRPARPRSASAWPASIARDDAEIVRGILARIGHRARVLVVNDALIALEAGAPGAPGIVIIAGTGSIAYGRDARRPGRARRRLGLRARRRGQRLLARPAGAARRRARGRRPRAGDDAHARASSRTIDVSRPEDLVREIYYGGARPAAIAALARDVAGARPTTAMPVALHIIETGAAELAAAATSVASRLRLDGGPVDSVGRHVPRACRACSPASRSRGSPTTAAEAPSARPLDRRAGARRGASRARAGRGRRGRCRRTWIGDVR